MSSARQQILARLEPAAEALTPEEGYAAVARPYIRRGRLNPAERLALLMERLREYDAEVVETTPAELRAAIARQLNESGRTIFAAPTGVPSEWRPQGFEWRVDGAGDDALSYGEIEETEGVVTAAFCAIADSGTIAIHHSAAEGRRVLTLLPDWHLCILRSSQVVETLPEYFGRCQKPPSLATYISGPSATADIEMTRIKGVHGPRFLHVLLVHDLEDNER